MLLNVLRIGFLRGKKKRSTTVLERSATCNSFFIALAMLLWLFTCWSDDDVDICGDEELDLPG